MFTSSTELKLLIDTDAKRLLYAEADKTAVDFLFKILSLPAGRIVNLLHGQEMEMTSLGNLYKSLECLKDGYMQSRDAKNALLHPPHTSTVPILMFRETAPNKKFYTCVDPDKRHKNQQFVAREWGLPCPNCKDSMNKGMTYVDGDTVAAEDGIVKGEVTFMVMDDLVVTPMSTTSILPLIKEVRSVESKSVILGKEEAVKILNAMMKSHTVLSDVFLKEEKADIVPKDETE